MYRNLQKPHWMHVHKINMQNEPTPLNAQWIENAKLVKALARSRINPAATCYDIKCLLIQIKRINKNDLIYLNDCLFAL